MRRLLSLPLLVPQLMFAQGPSASAIDPAVARRVVENIAGTVEASYVFPDTGRMIAEHLRGRLRAGVYDAPMDAGRLTDRITADMKATNGDLHLYVQYAGGRVEPNSPGPRMVMRRPGDPVPPDQMVMARRMNHNIDVVQRLPGNVGYLAVSELSGRSDEAYRVLDAAMALLERTDALIIDLRATRGGSTRMSDYLAGYFFADSTRTLSSYTRSVDRTFERWTARVNGTRRSDVPLFVLIGPGTASGAEDIAFTLKTKGRATLVGARTAGAGRLTAIYPVGDGFAASVPGGRTFDPVTGNEWERVGILPDIASPVDEALTVAHLAALERVIAAMADSAYRSALINTRLNVLARARPVAVPVTLLRQYAGTYDIRMIRFENGKLYYLRDANRPAEELTPIDDHSFALGEASRLEFVRDAGTVTAMRITTPLGQVSSFPRSP
jgi:hypothetical protein